MEEKRKLVVKRPTLVNRVANWGRIANLPKFNIPTIPDNFMQGSHFDHITEEVEELRAAMNRDVQQLSEIADAVGDIIWVALRFAMVHGLDINYVFSRIYESNMSKFCHTEQEAEDTVKAYADGTHPAKEGEKIETYAESVDDGRYFVIKRKSDEKVMKSINFTEPDFGELTAETEVEKEVEVTE